MPDYELAGASAPIGMGASKKQEEPSFSVSLRERRKQLLDQLHELDLAIEAVEQVPQIDSILNRIIRTHRL